MGYKWVTCPGLELVGVRVRMGFAKRWYICSIGGEVIVKFYVGKSDLRDGIESNKIGKCKNAYISVS